MSPKLRALPYLIILLPFDLLVALAMLAAWLCAFVPSWLKTGRREEGRETRLDPRATIVIVNWDGKHLLAEALPAVLEAVRFDGGKHEIMVVDNGSTDGSVEFIRANFPAVRVLALDRNYGFTGGNNRGVAEVETDIVVLLNNDMIVDRGFLKPLMNGFSGPAVFAVTSQIFFSDSTRRREETGKTRARFERGFFYLWHDDVLPDDEARESIPVFWAGGGSCAIDRHKYRALGGLDPLYSPFYVEDTDLSYQAWKRGWTCLLAPASHVVHKHRSTSKAKFGNRFVDNTIRRNQYLLIWKNVTDPGMILEHILNLPRIHGRAILRDEPGLELRAFFRALRRLPLALRKRLENISHYSLSDREVLARSAKP
jgi:O-antigen biosynthesis protein